MEIKVYDWLNMNIEKYICLDDEANAIKNAFSNLFSTECALDNERAKSIYNDFIANFYNNIIGYKNGFANRSIVAEDLDCYFINTSDGMVPIGYYRETRPVETTMLMQKYIEICEGGIPLEKNKIVTDWQAKLDLISSKYQEKKDKKHSSVFKCVVSLSLGIIGSILSVVSFFMAGGFFALSQSINKASVDNIRNRMPCLARAGVPEIVVFAWWMLIISIMLIGTSVFVAWELKLAKEKKLTDDLLKNPYLTVEKIETGIHDDLKNNLEEIHFAARQGKNLKVSKNQNATEITGFNEKIAISSKYVNRRNIHSNVVVLILLIIFVCAMPLCFTNVIPSMLDEKSYQQALSMMNNGEYTEAIAKFESIDFYKDSKDKIIECKYFEASVLLKNGEAQKAKTIFKQLDDYKDSGDMVTECDYKIAIKNKADGELLKAYNQFVALNGYKKAKEELEKLREPMYKKGIDIYRAKNYPEAKQYFEITNNYNRESDYLKLIDAHQGKLQNVEDIYYLIDFEDTKEILLADKNIFDFLEGNWTNSSGKYLTYERTSETNTHCSYNIPWSYDGEYYKLEGGCHYNGSDSTSWKKQWSFTIVDANTIEVYCTKNSSTYTLHRN